MGGQKYPKHRHPAAKAGALQCARVETPVCDRLLEHRDLYLKKVSSGRGQANDVPDSVSTDRKRGMFLRQVLLTRKDSSRLAVST